jgi:hypothetical protein
MRGKLKVYDISEIRNQWLSCICGSMKGHYGKPEIATCGLGGKCQSERHFNIRNRIAGTRKRGCQNAGKNVNFRAAYVWTGKFRKKTWNHV